MNLVFFNHFHNGDIFHAKEFVRDIAHQLQMEVSFSHLNSPALLSDAQNIKSIPMLNLPSKELFLMDDKQNFYINTHIGAWFGKGLPYDCECSLRFNMGMWEQIYKAVSEVFKKQLILHAAQVYIPFIDFTKFDIKRIQDFVAFEKRKKVLLCNGPAHSGQSPYNDDMTDFIMDWSQRYPNLMFITTQRVDVPMENVCSTSGIIAKQGSDLNEIGYLSTFCDLIVGRNSGPFCFSYNQINTCDPRRRFLSFGNSETDCFLLGIETRAKFSFHKFENVPVLKKTIEEHLDFLS